MNTAKEVELKRNLNIISGVCFCFRAMSYYCAGVCFHLTSNIFPISRGPLIASHKFVRWCY